MKKIRSFFKKFSNKKTHIQGHEDPVMKAKEHAEQQKILNSPLRKLSAGANSVFNAIKRRGGWDSKTSGRERNKGHHKAK